MSAHARYKLAVGELLEAAGVRKGDTLLVHSAFRTLSQQGLRAEAFVEETMDALGCDGILLMPAMSWRNVTQLNPLFDVRETAGNVGSLAETFRKHYASYRSVHPTHSVAGWGRDVSIILSGHHLLTTPCPMSSGFGQIALRNGKILLLGTGLESCTTIHCAEEAFMPEIYLDPIELAERYSCRDWEGEWHEVLVRRHRKIARDFRKFEPLLKAAGKLRNGRFLAAEWIMVEAQGLFDLVASTLKRDPRATLDGVSVADSFADLCGKSLAPPDRYGGIEEGLSE